MHWDLQQHLKKLILWHFKMFWAFSHTKLIFLQWISHFYKLYWLFLPISLFKIYLLNILNKRLPNKIFIRENYRKVFFIITGIANFNLVLYLFTWGDNCCCKLLFYWTKEFSLQFLVIFIPDNTTDGLAAVTYRTEFSCYFLQ